MGVRSGWATESLEQAIRRAILLPSIGGPLLMLVVLFGMPHESWRVPLALVYVANVAIGVGLAFVPRLAAGWVLAANYLALMITFIVAPSLDDALNFGNCWVTNLTSVGVVLVFRGPAAVILPALIGVTSGLALYLAHPDWPPTLMTASPVTQAAIGVGGWLAMRYLRGFAAQADVESERAEIRRRDVAAAEAASQSAAESSRTMHDTVINTLGAIANGGRVMTLLDQVRERCARDIAAVESLLNGQARGIDGAGMLDGTGPLARSVGIEVRRSGLAVDTVFAPGIECPQQVIEAIRGALHEVILNAAKHSGAAYVTLDAQQSAEGFSIAVRDDGVGMVDGHVPGYGLTESVMARCREQGVDVEVTSAAGAGTSVVFSYQPPMLAEDTNDDFAHVVANTQRRACWAWAVTVVLVGVWIEFTNHFGVLSMTWGMLGLVAVVSAIAWLAVRDARPLPRTVQSLLIASTPATFVLSLAGVEFGNKDLVLWQLLGTTVPPVILLYFSRSAVPFFWSIVAYVGTGLTCAWVISARGGDHAFAVIVGTASPLAVLMAFRQFHGAVARIGARAVGDQRAAAEDRRQLAARDAAERARLRWQAAGLHTSVSLLDRIAYQGDSPSDPAVRAACAREERYLRQLLMLSPDLIRMGYWLTRAASAARDQDVELALRTGDFDVADDDAARYIGELLLAAINSAQPGSRVTVGLFPRTNGGCVNVVVDASGSDSSTAIEAAAPAGLAVARQDYESQRLVEINWR